MSEFDEKARDWDTPQKQRRAENVARAIREAVALSPQMSVLEYGCGTGQLSFELRGEVGPILLADTSQGMLRVLGEKIAAAEASEMTPVELDLLKDALPAQRFDLIYSAMTLHHIPDTQKILEKFFALLNPGGYLCVADLDKEDGSFHGHDVHVHHGFARDALGKLARAAGFSQVSFSDADTMQKEVHDGRETRTFSIFLMVARKE